MPRIARAALHFWEEPCISGKNGSGTVFFSGCSLRCVYCQNRSIALGDVRTAVSTERLSEIFLSLQEQGAHNLNLVTPTHEIEAVVRALERAKARGLSIPVVYNTGGYEKVESLKLLDGLVDVWLPDLKYFDSALSKRYSGAEDYFSVASAAIAEMYRQAGPSVFSTEGDSNLMRRGVLVRHMVLPSHTADAKRVIRYLYETYGDDIFISIMSQYTPVLCGEDAKRFPELTRKITKREYEAVVDYAISLGVENAFIQEGDVAKESFIPKFDGTGVENGGENEQEA